MSEVPKIADINETGNKDGKDSKVYQGPYNIEST